MCQFHVKIGVAEKVLNFHTVCSLIGDSVMTYLKSVYWTVLAMTTIGDLPWPQEQSEFLYVIFELVIGLITFATVLGFIANIVTNVSAARKDFQGEYLQYPKSKQSHFHKKF